MENLVLKLEQPKGRVDVIIDTDTYNEIDDQYALAYLIRSNDKLNLQAIYAAPFSNNKAAHPEEGMNKSYNEIMNILTLMGEERYKEKVYKGSTSYLLNEQTYVESEAARDLIKRALDREVTQPLYIVAIGAITNIASALIMKPEIKEKMVVIWLGGNAHHWSHTKEFNMYQDIAAARVVFDSGVPLVQLPCQGVVTHFLTTGPELEYWLRGKNALCDYLIDVTEKEVGMDKYPTKTWSRVLWDVTAVAWLLGEGLVTDRFEHSPILQYDGSYSFDCTRHLIKYVYEVDRDKLLQDLFNKLAKG